MLSGVYFETLGCYSWRPHAFIKDRVGRNAGNIKVTHKPTGRMGKPQVLKEKSSFTPRLYVNLPLTLWASIGSSLCYLWMSWIEREHAHE